MHYHNSALGLLLPLLLSAIACTAKNEPTATNRSRSDVSTAVQQLERELPGTRVSTKNGRVSHIVGALASDSEPAAAVQRFLETRKKLLGLEGSDLVSPGPTLAAAVAPKPTPVMYDPDTGKHRFLLYKFEQQSNGIPVLDGGVEVLVRNEAPFTVVRVSSSTRDLSTFVPTINGQPTNLASAKQHLAKFRSATAAPARVGALATKKANDPKVVIWAGTRTLPTAPRLAASRIESTVDPEGRPDKVKIITDMTTGEVLSRKSVIVYQSVAGSVRGFATDDENAADCSTPTLENLPYATVTGMPGNLTASANVDGNYALLFDGATSATVTSTLKGHYFTVSDVDPTRDDTINTSVVPPQTQDFVHNEPLNAFSQAQVNAYMHANRVRDWVLSYEPDFPVIGTETQFPIFVNLAEYPCPGNAWFDPEAMSMSFCTAAGTKANSAFGSIVYHEYGHRILDAAGSGQDEFGEGMGDAITALLTDSPLLGVGMNAGQCTSPSRNAENDCQYSSTSCSTCGSEVHGCGQLLSGSIWSIRNALRPSYPDSYLQILTPIVLGSALIHTGSGITPDLVTDYLTLDDNDTDIGNGTPHRKEICAGFAAHGLECPALTAGITVSSTGVFTSSGMAGGPFVPASNTYNLASLGPADIDFTVTADVPWLSVNMASGRIRKGESLPIVVTFNERANTLPNGAYVGNVVFTDVTSHLGDTSRAVKLTVDPNHAVYNWSLDTDPGWSRGAAWGYGQPMGVAGDPTAGHTGEAVLGTFLDGAYPNNMVEQSLTTEAINCNGLTNVHLRFWRWLNAEISAFDRARIYASTDNLNFVPVWENTGLSMDSGWTPQSVDLSFIADNQKSVYLRWSLGPTDDSVVLGGWNIDDVEIWAIGQPIQTPQGVVASLKMDNDWGGGFCMTVSVKNNSATQTASNWTAGIDLLGTTTYTSWEANFSDTKGRITLNSVPWNATLTPGQTRTAGFCANRPAGNHDVPIVTSASGTF